MIKHVDNKSIVNLFSEKRLYIIPKYQRAYTWGKREWEQLFEDVTENEEGYFLGSIICVNDDVGLPKKFEVIDGQQRLTTLTIMLLAIYSKLYDLKNTFLDDEELLADYTNIRRELFEKIDNIIYPRIQLQSVSSNRDDYESLMNENGIKLNNIQKPKYRGLRSIEKAFNFFRSSLDQYIEEHGIDNIVEILFKIAKKFNSAVLVTIEVDTHKDAYMLFESLNNRGIPLSAIDLIKNILIRESEVDKAADETYEKWVQILKNLGENYSVEERFFRQYYNAYREELNESYKSTPGKKYELGYLATRTTLLDIYERMIKDQGYKKFVDSILKHSSTYSIIINNTNDNYLFSEELKDLERIQGAPSYLLLLYLLDNKKQFELTDNYIKEIIRYLTKFFVRRNLTDNPNTRNLTKIFMDIIEAIRELKGYAIVTTIKSNLHSVSSSNEIFESKLKGDIYLDNDTVTRFILCSIEREHQTKEIYTDLWQRNPRDNKYIWTIEHVFPEGQNIPKDWVDMIANGDTVLAQEYLVKYTHKLGNLTLTGYNQNLSNLSFEKKMNRKKDGKDVGYKNGLFLNQMIALKDKWEIKNIEHRTDELVKTAMKLFSLIDED